MGWIYEVDVRLVPKNFSSKLTLSVFGKVDPDITLNLTPGESTAAVIKAGIDYKCQESKLLPSTADCACVMYDLKRDPPVEVSSISSKLLADIPPALKLPGVDYSIKQPGVKITPDMQVTSTNEGKCYNVFIDVKAEFIPGQIEAKDVYVCSMM